MSDETLPETMGTESAAPPAPTTRFKLGDAVHYAFEQTLAKLPEARCLHAVVSAVYDDKVVLTVFGDPKRDTFTTKSVEVEVPYSSVFPGDAHLPNDCPGTWPENEEGHVLNPKTLPDAVNPKPRRRPR